MGYKVEVAKTPLPKKLSELLRVAVEDVIKTEKDPRFRLDMSVFFIGKDRGSCRVCMAGAVMAQRLECDPSAVITPDHFDDDTDNALRAIDHMRTGGFDLAASVLGVRVPLDLRPALDLARKTVDYGKFLYADRGTNNFGNIYVGHAPWGLYLEAADVLARAGL